MSDIILYQLMILKIIIIEIYLSGVTIIDAYEWLENL